MKQKFINAYMDVAHRFAQLSYAKRLQVGAIVVKNDRIISIGYNGSVAGADNNCEHIVNGELVTKPGIAHAELNVLAKLARSTESGEGATMFVTCAPCANCALLIVQSGISSVYYRSAYRSDDGVQFLKNAGVQVVQV